MALPNPTTLWKFAKVALRVAGEVVPASYAFLEATLTGDEEATPLEWIRWHVIATRTSPTGTTEDRAEFKLDLVNITGGDLDITWTAGDFAAIKGKFDTMLTTLASYTSADHTFAQYRAYRMAFNPDDAGPGNRGPSTGAFVSTGPPLYVQDISIVGTGAQAKLPRQAATTVTFRTAWPKHWGRIYLPGPNTALDTYARYIPTYRTAVANAVRLCIDDLVDADFLPMVPVTQVGKTKFHGLLGISDVVVDDIPDVQRSRRPRTVAARTIGV